jgi:3'-5' exoribonuclease
MSGPPEDLRGEPQKLLTLYNELVNEMRDHNISRFLNFTLRDDDDRWERFVTAPGARSENPGHHAFKGGLAYHTLTAAKLAGKIVDHYRGLGMSVKRDTVVAGVILHDIGKAWSYEWKDGPRKEFYHGKETEVEAGYTHTQVSKLHHHIPIGFAKFMQWAEDFNNAGLAHNLTEKKINHLGHIILAHHGRRSWSSPVIPKTIEAYIVHVVEMMDAYVDKYNKGTEVRNLYDH